MNDKLVALLLVTELGVLLVWLGWVLRRWSQRHEVEDVEWLEREEKRYEWTRRSLGL